MSKEVSNNNEFVLQSVYRDNVDEIVWAEIEKAGRLIYLSFDPEKLDDSFDTLDDSVEDYFKNHPVDIESLPHITDANLATRHLFHEVWTSDISMFYADNESEPWSEVGLSKKEFERQVDEDIKKFHLENVIEKNSDGCLYLCYGNLANSFSVDSKAKELSPFYCPDGAFPLSSEDDQKARRLYSIYQLHWMMIGRQSVDKLFNSVDQFNNGKESSVVSALKLYEEKACSNGSLWESYDDFRRDQFRDKAYMKKLCDIGGDPYLFDWYEKFSAKNFKSQKKHHSKQTSR